MATRTPAPGPAHPPVLPELRWRRVFPGHGRGPGEPRAIDDLAAERGRGLRLVRGLSVRTGFGGDRHGRLVWAQIAWNGPAPIGPIAPEPYRAQAREEEAARARRPAWAASLVGAR